MMRFAIVLLVALGRWAPPSWGQGVRDKYKPAAREGAGLARQAAEN